MFRIMRHRSRWLLLVPALAAGALAAAACGSDGVDEDDFAALQAQVADLQSQVDTSADTAERALLFALLPAFDASAFHAIDEQINNESLIHQTTPGIVQRAIDAVDATTWPASLQPHVTQLRDRLEALLAPVLDDDAESAGLPATIAHGLIHSFEQAVSAYLAGEEVPDPPDIGAVSEHSESEEDHADEADHAEDEHEEAGSGDDGAG
jgi:hypothetical protein